MPRPSQLFVPGLRLSTAFAALFTVLGATSAARAECPPGSWFCADPSDDKAAPKEGAATPVTPPKEGEVRTVRPGESTTVAPGGTTTIIVQTAPPPAPAPAPRPAPPVAPPARAVYTVPVRRVAPPVRVRRQQAEWGLNLHLQGAMMSTRNSQASNSDAGMGGLGFSIRARPTGHFALDLGLDFMSGTDYNGYKRSEIPFTVNALLFVNPRDRLQLYFLGGMGWSAAQVEVNNYTEKYSYFGLQTGIGLEYRATRNIALNADLIGFVRGRTDRSAAQYPEFVDPNTGRTTNTSGGGLLRGGLTFYW